MSTQDLTKTRFPPSDRIAGHGEKDVWGLFTPLARAYEAVNLGQGFPNLPPPAFLRDAVVQAIDAGHHQYAPTRGWPRLRRAIAKAYASQVLPTDTPGDAVPSTLDPEAHVLVTQGANQGILCVLQTYLNPGEEVLLIEPFFDLYRPAIRMCDGVVRSVPLRRQSAGHDATAWTEDVSANAWTLDPAELEAAVTPRTKFLLLNTPHNPTGKVFSRKELEMLADVCKRHDLMVLSDEVYDKIAFESPHVSISSLPGMWERTITVFSAGKTFGITGWRVGWLVGAAPLIRYCVAAQARTVFCVSTPLQEAVAIGLEHVMAQAAQGNDFYATQRALMQEKRDHLADTFRALGCPVATTQGSYFMLVNLARLLPHLERRLARGASAPLSDVQGAETEALDVRLCRWLTTQVGVTAIPPSSFYSPENAHLADGLARFCFCKTEDTLTEARERLSVLKALFSSN